MILISFFGSGYPVGAALKTGIINRVGDVALLFGGVIFLFYGRMLLSLIFMVLGGLVKSAQFPFFSWLPAAMAAPTPVSALVHSSTLVTAGVWVLFVGNVQVFSVLALGLVSSFVGGLMAVWEVDLKKVVAFSTLSQLGFMFFSLGVVDSEVGVFFLFVHALFKALLFISVGYFIFGFSHEQCYKIIGRGVSLIIMFGFLVSLFSMVGGQFFIMFFLKHSLGGLVEEFGELFFLFFLVLSLFTGVYCFRLLRASAAWGKRAVGFKITKGVMFLPLVCIFSGGVVFLEAEISSVVSVLVVFLWLVRLGVVLFVVNELLFFLVMFLSSLVFFGELFLVSFFVKVDEVLIAACSRAVGAFFGLGNIIYGLGFFALVFCF